MIKSKFFIPLLMGILLSMAQAYRAPEPNANQSRAKKSQQDISKKREKVLQRATLELFSDPAVDGFQATKNLKLESDAQNSLLRRANRRFNKTGSSVELVRVRKDRLGNSHITLRQHYKGYPVIGGEIIAHVDAGNTLYAVSGWFADKLTPKETTALDIKKAGDRALDGLEDFGPSIMGEPGLVIYKGKLAFEVMLKSTGNTPGAWTCYVDANSGEVLLRLDRLMRAAPGPKGQHEEVRGIRLSGEDSTEVKMEGWHDEGGNWFLYHKDALWGIENEDTRDWEQKDSPDWEDSDPAAVSLGKNFSIVQQWVTKVLERHSFDDAGAFARAVVHVGTDYVNAYWDGSAFYFGDGDGVIANPLTVLDIAAHEYGHAITQYTSNLVYQYESGALNESYSDILGAVVEFYAQPNGRDSYPKGTPGHGDWLCGEDSWLEGDALRDLQDPQRFDQPSYYLGTHWYDGHGDNGGVHTNSGVQNFAFYLLAEGGKGDNDGHPYSINGLGLEAAADIALYANMYVLTSEAQYQDSRNAWILAAATLGYDVPTVEDVWTAVGVVALEKHLSAQPTALAYGSVGLGTGETLEVVLSNDGGDATLVSGIASDNPAFTIADKAPFLIPGGGSTSLKVTFTPNAMGDFAGQLKIESNAEDNPTLSIELAGTGAQPAVIAIQPETINEAVNVGDSIDVTVTVTNNGEADLKFTLSASEEERKLIQSAPALIPGTRSQQASYNTGKSTDKSGKPRAVANLHPDFQAQSSNLNVLYLTTILPTGGSDDFVRGIQGLSNVGKLDIVDGMGATPNLDYLLEYDVVIAASNAPWADPKKLGDYLADYVDAGGTLCLLVATIANDGGYGLSGRIISEKYMPITMGGPGRPGSLGTLEKHPITEGVRELSTEIPIQSPGVFGKGLPLGVYADGNLAGAYHETLPIVAVNVFPVDGYWGGDLILMMGNALDWLGGRSFISVVPENTQIVVARGESFDFTVILNAKEIVGDTWLGRVDIAHNDPARDNPLSIPVTFQVDGYRQLAVNPDAHDFGNVWKGTSSTTLFELINAGTEVTRIREVSLNDAAYAVLTSLPMAVVPGEPGLLEIRFSPTEVRSYPADMVILSDAEDNSELKVTLNGTGTQPPVAAVMPRSMEFNFGPRDAPADETGQLSNHGGDILTYLFTARETGNPYPKMQGGTSVPAAILSHKIYDKANYKNAYLPGRVIVGFVKGVSGFANQTALAALDIQTIRPLAAAINPLTKQKVPSIRNMVLVQIQPSQSVMDAIQILKSDANVAFAEPDYVIKAIKIPNDPDFKLLYGMHNEGQTGGTPDADIDAPEAWKTHTGNKRVLIGVIDTGIDYLHPDLQANMWTNPGEIPDNGLDDDGNGFVDDIHGWDFAYDDNDPMDVYGHGTHCAGTIAGVGDNGAGVAGVMWQADVMAIKFLDDWGGGSTSDAIDAVNYATAMNLNITSNSWGGGGFSQGLLEAIQAGNLFIAAAGNSSSDNDTWPHYPSSYEIDNVIAVAATDNNDKLAGFSSYGEVSVDLGAPGVDIYSCVPGGGYGYGSGTSMATPHVAGAAGLIWSYNPSLLWSEVRKALLDGVDPLAGLSDKVATGGRLNVSESLKKAGPTWLTLAPMEPGQLAPGQEQNFTVTVNPAGLVAGQWKADVLVNSNDPRNPVIPVSVTADISGCKSLSAEPLALDFGTVWTDRDSVMTFQLTNKCNDWVTVRSLEFDDPQFTADLAVPFAVDPFSSREVSVAFAPGSPEKVTGTLTIESNAEDNSSITLSLNGTGILPPKIEITPPSVVRSLFPWESDMVTLTLTNSGDADFHFEASGQAVEPDPEGIKAAPLIGPQTAQHTIQLSREGKLAAIDYADRRKVSRKKIIPRPALNAGKVPAAIGKGLLFATRRGYIVQLDPQTGAPLGDSIAIQPNSGPEGLAYDGQYLYYVWENSDVLVLNPATGEEVRTIPNDVPDGIDGLGVSKDHLILANYYSNTIYVIDKKSGAIEYQWPVKGFPGGVSFAGSRNTVFIGNVDNGQIEERRLEDGELLNAFPGGWDAYGVAYSAGADMLFITAWDGTDQILALDPDDGTVLHTISDVGYIYALAADESGPSARWLEILTQEGVVPAGGSLDVEIGLNAAGVPAGEHLADVVFDHAFGNPPGPYSARFQLTVKPYRSLVTSPAILEFPVTWVGKQNTMELVLSNAKGSSPTHVLAILKMGTAFSHNAATPLTIPAYDSVAFEVTFTPPSPGRKLGVIGILSNADNNPLTVVQLKGTGVRPPEPSVKPNRIRQTLELNKTTAVPVILSNTGGADYHFKLQARPLDDNKSVNPAGGEGVLFISAMGDILRLNPANGEVMDTITTIREGKYEGLAYDGEYLYYISDLGTEIKVISPEDGGIVRTIPIESPTGRLGITALGVSDQHLITHSWRSGTCAVLDKETGALVYSWAAPNQFPGGLSYGGSRGTVFLSFADHIEERKLENGELVNSFPAKPMCFGLAYSESDGKLYGAGEMAISVYDPETGAQLDVYPTKQFLGYSGLAADEAGPMLKWLSTSIQEGMVPPGGSVEFDVTLNSTQLLKGVYDGRLNILHHPDYGEGPSAAIECALKVKGLRDIKVSPSSLDFGPIWQEKTGKAVITLHNAGNAPTKVRSLKLNSVFFSHPATPPLMIPPFDSISFNVLFQPNMLGKYKAKLVIKSNAKNKKKVIIPLKGKCVVPPIVFTKPKQVRRKLTPAETETITLKLKNIGGADYHFKAGPRYPENPDKEAVSTGNIEDAVLYTAQAGTLYQLDPSSGNIIGKPLPLPDRSKSSALAFDGEYLYYAGDFGTEIFVLDPATGSIIRTIELDTIFHTTGLGVSDNYLIALNGFESKVTVLDKENGEKIHRWPVKSGGPYGLTFGGDRGTVFLCTGEAIEERELETGKVVNVIQDRFQAFGLAYSRAAGVIFATDGKTLLVLDPATGDVLEEMVLETPPGYNGLAADEAGATLSWLSVSPESGTLGPKETLELNLTLDPKGLLKGVHEGFLDILFDDPDIKEGPNLEVPVRLKVLPYHGLAVSPAEPAFGEVKLGESKTLNINLINTGNEPLTVREVSLPHPEFAGKVETPAVIQAYEKLTFPLAYTPADLGDDITDMMIESDAQNSGIIPVTITGSGIPAGGLVIQPAEFNFKLIEGDTLSAEMLMINTGKEDFPFIINVLPEKGPDPVAWLIPEFTEGKVPGGGDLAMSVTFESAGLPPGEYAANLEVVEDVKEGRRYLVPCKMTLVPGRKFSLP